MCVSDDICERNGLKLVKSKKAKLSFTLKREDLDKAREHTQTVRQTENSRSLRSQRGFSRPRQRRQARLKTGRWRREVRGRKILGAT